MDNCFICRESLSDGHNCLRVYADPANKAVVIASRKERGYDLVEWIAGGYSGGDVAYFRRNGSTKTSERASEHLEER